MNLDLKNLREMAQDEVNNAKAKSSRSNDGYPIVYPGENGKLTVRLLYNLKSNIVQRRLIRHNSGKDKVACLQIYGEDCPVCEAISNAENLKGKECGAFKKYGFKNRGICYAQIIDHDPAYFKNDKDPQKGDTVLLMYPKTVYDQINEIIVNAGDNLEKLLSNNDGIPIVIERSQKGKGLPDYNTYVYPYGSKKSFKGDGEKTGDEKFDELLSSLPDLNDTIIPSYPNDEVRKKNRALADTINGEYINSSVVNPNDNIELNNSEAMLNNDESDSSISERVSNIGDIGNQASIDNTNNEQPECFGNHKDNDKKCMLCPYEADCYMEN